MSKRKVRKDKGRIPVWQIVTLIAGLSLLAAPVIADRISAKQADDQIDQYASVTASYDEQAEQKALENAVAYNNRLAGIEDGFPVQDILPYEQQISSGDGAFAWIEIPELAEKLPIYHGTAEKDLEAGVGHLEWTSLPVGGENTHAVLTGHSGMPGSRMFDDIDKLKPGDVFIIHVLHESLAYKVTSTEVVWPDDVDSLYVQDGKDLCTLVTCTPYGINDHRLFVHAERTEYDPQISLGTNNMALFFNTRTVPLLVAIAGTLIFFLSMFVMRKRRYPIELGVLNPWNGLSDDVDDRRRTIRYDYDSAYADDENRNVNIRQQKHRRRTRNG